MTRIFSCANMLALMLIVSLPAFARSPDPAVQPAQAAEARFGRGADWSLDEYLSRQRASAERRFRRLDLNGDGVLSADERRAARGSRAQATD